MLSPEGNPVRVCVGRGSREPAEYPKRLVGVGLRGQTTNGGKEAEASAVAATRHHVHIHLGTVVLEIRNCYQN